jgi:hypothetical protein
MRLQIAVSAQFLLESARARAAAQFSASASEQLCCEADPDERGGAEKANAAGEQGSAGTVRGPAEDGEREHDLEDGFQKRASVIGHPPPGFRTGRA